MTCRWFGCLWLIAAPMIAVQADMLGYSNPGAGVEEGWEAKFRDGISPAEIRENMRRLSARPHHVGSAYDKDNAEWILAEVQGVGVRGENRDLQRAVSDARRFAFWKC